MIDCSMGLLPITLEEMKAVKLMNRTDTKFVTSWNMLQRLLALVKDDYFVQVTNGTEEADYHTLYYDTADNRMYTEHHNGKKSRQKLRIRSYVASDEHFLEIKTKNNHGKTKKKRVKLDCRIGTEGVLGEALIAACDLDEHSEFINERLWLAHQPMIPKIENRFYRITLVNKGKTERLTIDYNLRFHNFESGNSAELKDVVIIELKRDSLQPSPILPYLRQLRIFPMGFSKYCIGMAITNPALKQNRFKERIRKIKKIN